MPIDGDGHWYICLDYRKDKQQPKVSWIDVECDNQEDIADSFAAFLALLELDVENELVIETESSIEDVSKQIEAVLQIKFDEPDYFNSGYANYRSKYKDSWIWLTPNKVPQGFVRENDKRYNILKEQMDIFSVRYIEIPQTHLFLELSEEELNNEVIQKLSDNNILIKPISAYIQKNSTG
ncbi:SMI1/KNR4 family protein [Sphingobacterium sp. SRCM116780]|nr:SMI1/KNR4 family protein [Sphingobacterium sp. SRCM116780]UIR57340.1 SMI1/KNR4 family protein [Sphingobacterium sp. SRCM116780]